MHKSECSYLISQLEESDKEVHIHVTQRLLLLDLSFFSRIDNIDGIVAGRATKHVQSSYSRNPREGFIRPVSLRRQPRFSFQLKLQALQENGIGA